MILGHDDALCLLLSPGFSFCPVCTGCHLSLCRLQHSTVGTCDVIDVWVHLRPSHTELLKFKPLCETVSYLRGMNFSLSPWENKTWINTTWWTESGYTLLTIHSICLCNRETHRWRKQQIIYFHSCRCFLFYQTIKTLTKIENRLNKIWIEIWWLNKNGNTQNHWLWLAIASFYPFKTILPTGVTNSHIFLDLFKIF